MASSSTQSSTTDTSTRTGAEWRDMNKDMFFTKQELVAKYEALLDKIGDAPTDPKDKARLIRLRRQIQDLTDRIVQENYGLVRNYVNRFTGKATRDQAEEYEAAGVLGLMKAIEKYDPSKGLFSSWAFKPIQREVLRAVHATEHSNMTSGDFEKRHEILRANETLRGDRGDGEADIEQIAEQAGVTLAQAKRVINAPRIDSIHLPIGDGDSYLEDLISTGADNGVEDEVLSSIDVRALESYGLSELTPRELFVLSRRVGLDCEPEQRLSAIGSILGLSREAVRQIESKAISKMSHPVLLRKLVRDGR